ncbi:uncharacterized protein LOC132755510 [Ruditapes philippinarum]|uniref:uncharacterized protein LOC132755510 n=1 Tax=Ruditapes philippinarum TaxID=129788 RepID=UPI00295A7E79|nr:uncharacterized protein LOC132755510 [Ruditapes philippinarum]
MEISSPIPDLPPNKKYHLFVCYERNSLCTVAEIVQNLEREGVVCCYFERDFVPGRSITDNMYDAIEKSMNMLIVLSEELENSCYCLDEIDKAFNLRVQGQYNLIPIRIEPCSVPVCLQHLVYIDVEEAIDEAHTKIIDAMVKKDQQNALKEDSNGKNIEFGLKANKPNFLSLTRYRLKITEKERSKLWKQQFEVSAEILQEVEDTFNRSYYIRLHHVIDHQYLLMTFVFLFFLILIMIIFSILVLMLKGEKTDKLTSAEMCLAVGLPTWFISYTASMIVLGICHCRSLMLFKLKLKVK